jgi:hypothetical protein
MPSRARYGRLQIWSTEYEGIGRYQFERSS